MTFRHPTLAALPLLAGTLLLGACGDKVAKGDGGMASSQVLEGTIGDDMIPLEDVRSQAPLAGPEKPEATTPGKGAPATSGEGEKAADSAGTGATPSTGAAPSTGSPPAASPAPAPKPSAPADPIGAAVRDNAGR